MLQQPKDLDESERCLRDFIERHPLYTPLNIQLVISDGKPLVPDWPGAIARPCGNCGHVTTWQRVGFEIAEKGFPDAYMVRFRCVLCTGQHLRIWIRTSRVGAGTPWQLRKVGQDPPWDASLPAELKALNADDQDLYRRGLVSLSQGYGLAAVAYFRRVVENNVHSLCDLVVEASRAEGDDRRVAELEEVRRGRVAEEKLRAIVGLLPAVLRVGGRNPLKELYDGYSAALHGLPDDECAAVALRLKTVFEFSFGTLADQLTRIRAFQATAPTAPAASGDGAKPKAGDARSSDSDGRGGQERNP